MANPFGNPYDFGSPEYNPNGDSYNGQQGSMQPNSTVNALANNAGGSKGKNPFEAFLTHAAALNQYSQPFTNPFEANLKSAETVLNLGPNAQPPTTRPMQPPNWSGIPFAYGVPGSATGPSRGRPSQSPSNGRFAYGLPGAATGPNQSTGGNGQNILGRFAYGVPGSATPPSFPGAIPMWQQSQGDGGQNKAGNGTGSGTGTGTGTGTGGGGTGGGGTTPPPAGTGAQGTGGAGPSPVRDAGGTFFSPEWVKYWATKGGAPRPPEEFLKDPTYRAAWYRTFAGQDASYSQITAQDVMAYENSGYKGDFKDWWKAGMRAQNTSPGSYYRGSGTSGGSSGSNPMGIVGDEIPPGSLIGPQGQIIKPDDPHYQEYLNNPHYTKNEKGNTSPWQPPTPPPLVRPGGTGAGNEDKPVTTNPPPALPPNASQVAGPPPGFAELLSRFSNNMVSGGGAGAPDAGAAYGGGSPVPQGGAGMYVPGYQNGGIDFWEGRSGDDSERPNAPTPPPPTPPTTPTPPTPPNGTAPADVMAILRQYLGPQFQQEQTDLTRAMNAQGAVTGDINSGGFQEAAGRNMSRLVSEQGARVTDYLQQSREAALSRELQKYGIDKESANAMAQAAASRAMAGANLEASKYSADRNYSLGLTNADIDRENNIMRFILGMYGLDSEMIKNILGSDPTSIFGSWPFPGGTPVVKP